MLFSPSVAKMGELGWKARPGGQYSEEGSSRIATVSQVSMHQMRTVPSRDFEARRRLSSENEICLTEPVWTSRILVHCPEFGSQRRMVLSVEPETNIRPSGDQTTL